MSVSVYFGYSLHQMTRKNFHAKFYLAIFILKYQTFNLLMRFNAGNGLASPVGTKLSIAPVIP
jgi:hypothetical protein